MWYLKVIWLDLICIGSVIYCNAFFPHLSRTNMADFLFVQMAIYGENSYLVIYSKA